MSKVGTDSSSSHLKRKVDEARLDEVATDCNKSIAYFYLFDLPQFIFQYIFSNYLSVNEIAHFDNSV